MALTNRALTGEGASVSTPSGESGGNVVGRAIDGNDTTWWNAVQIPANAFLLVDLGTSRDITWIEINQGGGTPSREYAHSIDVQTSPDNSAWSTVETWNIPAPGQFWLKLASATAARYWRFDPTAGGDFGWIVRTVALYDGTADSTAPIRMTQVAGEALAAPTTAGAARITQVTGEAMVSTTTGGTARMTQVVAEVLLEVNTARPTARMIVV